VSASTRPDPPITPTRTLRRLGHLPAVATTYESRDLDIGTLDALAEAAARRGYDEGYAEGLAGAAHDVARARDEESERAAKASAALAQAVVAVYEVERRMRAEAQTAVPKFAFALLEALLAREQQVSVDPAREAIMRALTLDEGTEPATVRLNPADVGTIGEVSLSRQVCVIADAAVEPGGALVEIERATLDGQLGSALERVRRVLFGPEETGVDDDRSA
jgi:flagellar assembly protein FliH